MPTQQVIIEADLAHVTPQTVLVLRFPEAKLDDPLGGLSDAVADLGRQLYSQLGFEVTVLAIPHDARLENLTEDDMRRAGWVLDRSLPHE